MLTRACAFGSLKLVKLYVLYRHELAWNEYSLAIFVARMEGHTHIVDYLEGLVCNCKTMSLVSRGKR